jgi:hypothetical protein
MDHPPGKLPLVVRIALVVWCVFILVAFSDAGFGLSVFFGLFIGGAVWAFVWSVRLGVVLWRQRKGSVPVVTARQMWRYWAVEPVVLSVTAAIGLSGVLLHLRLQLSMSALESFAAEVAAGRVSTQRRDAPARWVGLFRIREVERLDDGTVRLITCEDGMLDEAGIVRSPKSDPPVIGEDTYSHLSGPWFRWHRSW